MDADRIPPRPSREEALRAEAWIGDAVLALFARERILREHGLIDGERCERMTSNQFLSALGEPTAVEARIGRAYQEGGLARAFAWIESEIVPLAEKQEAKRARTLSVRRPG
jgi:dsRNA-specific ribonuclease